MAKKCRISDKLDGGGLSVYQTGLRVLPTRVAFAVKGDREGEGLR